jgi:Transposase DDE domain
VCEHGAWLYKGADYKRKRGKWRCPAGRCQPTSIWLPSSRFHPLIPRHTNRYQNLRAGRAAIEQCIGRLKNEYGLKPLRVRGQERVALHMDLCGLALLASALARSRTPVSLVA